MRKAYPILRGCLAKEGIGQSYLCELMGKSQGYITRRITGKKPWSQDDQYFLMDLCHIPYEQMHLVFPKRGGV